MYTLRKIMKGMVCGPLDKNNGELWLACPCLYKKALEKVYPTTGGDYEVIHPKKVIRRSQNIGSGAVRERRS